MSKDTTLNLPDGILQLYQRRYSDPTPSSSHRVLCKPPRPRRFSLTTFDDLKDISSRSVRTQVNQILSATGHVEYIQAKTSQLRRYSTYAHTQVENNLGDLDKRGRRSSFAEKIENLTEENKGRKRSYCDLSRKKSITSYWNDKELEEYQNHLSKNKPSPYGVCDDQYWACRRSKSVDHSDTSTKLPTCGYKLRGNGLIATELLSAYGVHIQGVARSVSVNSTQSRTKVNDQIDSAARSPSNLSSHGGKPHSVLRNRPGSSPCVSKRASVSDVVGPTPSNTTRMSQLDDNFKYSFFNPSKYNGTWSVPTTTQTVSLKETDTSPDPADIPCCLNSKPRRMPDINFEIIGNPTLHGSPMYSGRLKLCSYRSFSFGKS